MIDTRSKRFPFFFSFSLCAMSLILYSYTGHPPSSSSSPVFALLRPNRRYSPFIVLALRVVWSQNPSSRPNCILERNHSDPAVVLNIFYPKTRARGNPKFACCLLKDLSAHTEVFTWLEPHSLRQLNNLSSGSTPGLSEISSTSTCRVAARLMRCCAKSRL